MAEVRRQRIPALTTNARASCARPCGLCRPPLTVAEGDPIEATRSCAQKQELELELELKQPAFVGAAEAAML